MKRICTTLNDIVLSRAKRTLIRHYGKDFYEDVRKRSRTRLMTILESAPAIGRSVFEINYYFILCYVSWFLILEEKRLSTDARIELIWLINEKFFSGLPRPFLRLLGRLTALHHQVVGPKRSIGATHPADWKFNYRRMATNHWRFDIHECAILKISERFRVRALFPAVCRIDYLINHYLGIGFTRTQTLGDGDAVCDCVYRYPGRSPWPLPRGAELK